MKTPHSTLYRYRTMKLNARHEKAVFNLSVGLPITPTMFHQLQSANLAERLTVDGADYRLTEKGCDLAAGRLTIKSGAVVKA